MEAATASCCPTILRCRLGPGRRYPKGRFFNEADTFAWHFFQAEAYLDHIQNYEPIYGSRVVPLMIALGKNLPALLGVGGVERCVRRMVGSERSQPNGGMFELLVAAAYTREGFEVRFVEEQRGGSKTHDMDVRRRDREWAVECKRLEVSEYGSRERIRSTSCGAARPELRRHGTQHLCRCEFPCGNFERCLRVPLGTHDPLCQVWHAASSMGRQPSTGSSGSSTCRL